MHKIEDILRQLNTVSAKIQPDLASHLQQIQQRLDRAHQTSEHRPYVVNATEPVLAQVSLVASGGSISSLSSSSSLSSTAAFSRASGPATATISQTVLATPPFIVQTPSDDDLSVSLWIDPLQDQADYEQESQDVEIARRSSTTYNLSASSISVAEAVTHAHEPATPHFVLRQHQATTTQPSTTSNTSETTSNNPPPREQPAAAAEKTLDDVAELLHKVIAEPKAIAEPDAIMARHGIAEREVAAATLRETERVSEVARAPRVRPEVQTVPEVQFPEPKLVPLTTALAEPDTATGLPLFESLWFRQAAPNNYTSKLVDRILKKVPNTVPAVLHFCQDIQSQASSALVSTQIAWELSRRGLGEVLLVDADYGHRDISRQLGHVYLPGLTENINLGHPLDVLIRSTGVERLSWLPSGSGDISFRRIAGGRWAEISVQLRRRFQWICVHAGAAQDRVTATWGRFCDYSYLITSMEDELGPATKQVVDLLRTTECRVSGLITID